MYSIYPCQEETLRAGGGDWRGTWIIIPTASLSKVFFLTNPRHRQWLDNGGLGRCGGAVEPGGDGFVFFLRQKMDAVIDIIRC